ncbi:hypothetical protein HanXRQr2_Chr14g0664981 [Helianthus annuus]|uniref:Uncharacterized protein n=1 Tax=Helianthus annuus TaxID=4232 RepID=A0A9K3HA71_HELAN|nr:hypothetical protein HanXRQr2_Chr14g0664981 [Helianthus annuus]KAJ0842132.1 hypothetical protein HanPSC8_Chr14g0638241 [Helianthus annuus]
MFKWIEHVSNKFQVSRAFNIEYMLHPKCLKVKMGSSILTVWFGGCYGVMRVLGCAVVVRAYGRPSPESLRSSVSGRIQSREGGERPACDVVC